MIQSIYFQRNYILYLVILLILTLNYISDDKTIQNKFKTY